MTPQELQFTQFAQWFDNPLIMTGITLLAIWSLTWKGIALWKAARNASKIWFIVMLIVNTSGILEIIYIFFFSKRKQQNSQL